MNTAPIVPRWEWRCFGERFGRADAVLAQLVPERVDDSDEIYLLSPHSDASVKIRDDLLDVKHREEVADDLELWRPVLKAAFPVNADDLAIVLAALGIDRAVHAAAIFADFERDVVEQEADLHALRVRKRRAHYTVEGCMVELTTIETGGSSRHTLAIESESPSLVRDTIHRLGLDHRANVNMARGLKTMVTFGVRRFAVIDVGTNSVKYVIGEREDGTMRIHADGAIVTRLGEDLARAGVIGAEPMERTADAIASIVRDAQTGGAVTIIAVGTAGLRSAKNRAEFVEAVDDRTGITVDVISGETESELAYIAAVATLPVRGETFVVFDTGGGSSQFTFGHGQQVDERFSLDIGAARVAERFDLIDRAPADRVRAALEAIGDEFAMLANRPVTDAIIGMGGTATNLAAVRLGLEVYDADRVHGTVLDIAEIDRQIELYRTQSVDERRRVAGLQPARAEVILAGAIVLRTILTKLGHDEFTVSDRGLRHGLLATRFP